MKAKNNKYFIAWSIVIMNCIINSIKQQNKAISLEQKVANSAPHIDTKTKQKNK